jgi:hypothetical protein
VASSVSSLSPSIGSQYEKPNQTSSYLGIEGLFGV